MSGQAQLASFVPKSTTIASGASLSAGVSCLGFVLLGVELPSTWTNADVTFQGSTDDGATYKDLVDEDGVEILYDCVVNDNKIHLALPASPMIGGLTHIKVRSGTSAIPVNQGGDRSVKLIFGVVNP